MVVTVRGTILIDSRVAHDAVVIVRGGVIDQAGPADPVWLDPEYHGTRAMTCSGPCPA